MKAGALEFMTKPFREDVMLRAIESAIDHSRVSLRQEAICEGFHRRYSSLSRRERQVMALVAQGRLNKLIGAELGISEITVKARRVKVMRKMSARSLPELVTIAASLALGLPPTNASRIEQGAITVPAAAAASYQGPIALFTRYDLIAWHIHRRCLNARTRARPLIGGLITSIDFSSVELN